MSEFNFEQEYVVLRDLQPGRRVRGVGGPGVAHTAPRVDEIEIKTEVLTEAGARRLRSEPTVAEVAPRLRVKLVTPVAAASGPSPAGAGNATWGLDAVGATSSDFDGAGVTVAVLDTGINLQHEAFQPMAAKISVKDFTGTGDGDGNGHGSHVAGTIGGQDVNGTRIGVARNLDRLLVGKVLNDQGGGTTKGIADGIWWAMSEGANVVSMSLGFDLAGAFADLVVNGNLPPDLAGSRVLAAYRQNLRLFDRLGELSRSMQAAVGGSSLLIAASGNESRRHVHPQYTIDTAPPAAAENVMSVGAVSSGAGGLQIADFSNTSPHLVAPGVAVLSANAHDNAGLVSLNGTSMATPHVSGLAALHWQAEGQQGGIPTAERIFNRLVGSAVRGGFAAPPSADDVGRGMARAP